VRPDRGIVGRIEGHGQKIGLQVAKGAGSGNHEGGSSGNYVFRGIDDVASQLVRKACVCELLIVMGDPEAKIVGALLVKGRKQRVGKSS